MSFYTTVIQYWEPKDAVAAWLVENCMKLSKDNVEMAQKEYQLKFEAIEFPKKLFQVEVNVPNFLYPTNDGGDVLYAGDKDLLTMMNDSTDSYFLTINNDWKCRVIDCGAHTDIILMSDKKERR
jgi:hypothetical protein